MDLSRASRTTCRQQLHEIPLRLVTAHEIIEIGLVLFGLSHRLAKPLHASEHAAGRFIIVRAAETDHSFNTICIDLLHFGGMALFTRFGKLPEQVFGAAMFVDYRPRLRQQSFLHGYSNESMGR